jgi:hypothetical protein
MYISTSTLLFSALALTSSVSALQTIFIGHQTGSCSYSNKYGHFAIWFSDSDVCSSDTLITGYPGRPLDDGGSLCLDEYTILGHTGITFTGCVQDFAAGGLASYGLPTGVSDGGNPALTCEVVTMPDVSCTDHCTDGSTFPALITTYLYCS